jgi:hypothetical protein
MLGPVWNVVYVGVQVAAFGALAGLLGYLVLRLGRLR